MQSINKVVINLLDKVDPETEEGERCWAYYLSSWTIWNHVRTAAGLVAPPC